MGILKLKVKKKKYQELSMITLFYLIIIANKSIKSFPDISSVIPVSKLFRSGSKKINFQFHDNITVYILHIFPEHHKTHECYLRLSLNDQERSFVELLRKNNDITNHQKHIEILLTKDFKTTKTQPSNYGGRFKKGLETLSSHGRQLWSLFPGEIKSLTSLDCFKRL